jgi:hypothetical protein
VETRWLRLEIDPASGAITGLAADPSGKGDFSHPVLQPPAGDAARRFGVFAAARGADGAVSTAAAGDGFAVTPSAAGVTVSGLRIGEALSARMEAALAPDAPELLIRTIISADAETSCRWAGLLLALDPRLAPETVYFAGRQGLASISPGRIITPAAPASGAVCKHGAERTFVFTCSPPAGVEIELTKDRAAIAIAPVIGGLAVNVAQPPPAPPALMTLRKSDTVTLAARFVFGMPRLPALKAATSKFQPLAQDFIFWATHIATARPFDLAQGEPSGSGEAKPSGSGQGRPTGPRWMQETAAVIDPGLPAEIQQAYRRCWLRDIAHGWKSAVLVAGPELLAVMRDEILTFAEKLNDAGHPPTHIGPDGGAAHGNLDSSGLLIGMIYDYVSRTGDTQFVRALLPQADRMGTAIIALIGPHGLPVIGHDADTYPDLGFIKGEQTYLAAVCCDGLRKLARLYEIVGEAESGAKWHLAANRVAFAANRAANPSTSSGSSRATSRDDKDGLWDQERGVYIGWRNPDGSLYRSEESFANLWAIYSGLCDDGARVRSIFARLNSNWQRYYLDGLCPTALSIEPYPNGLNQWVPWAGGWDIYLRAKLGEPRAEEVWRLFLADYERTDFPYREASGYQQKEANAGNRGRIWDSWGFLQAVYAGHYGVEMTPGHLRVLPRPLEPITDDGISGLAWRDAIYDIALRGRGLHLARVTVDNREWASCVLPADRGKHQVVITASASPRKAFVMDAAPIVEMLAAKHEEKGLLIEASVPSPGRHWFVLQWPDAWGRVEVKSFSGAGFPQTLRLAGERAAMLVTVGRAGKFALTLAGSTSGITR